MLHPHIPEDLKHFGKHLFATFLGLLMALGLEQWREHQHESKIAHQALVQVEAELEQNRRELERRMKTNESEMAPMKTYVDGFTEAVQARRNGHRMDLPVRPVLQMPDFFFTCSAWEAAKSLGLLRHLSPDRTQRISEAYAAMHRVEEFMNGMASSTAVQDLIVFGHAAQDTLNQADLERLAYAFRFQQNNKENQVRLGKEILGTLKEAQRP